MAQTVIIRWDGISGNEATAMYDALHPELMSLVTSERYPGLVAHVCSKHESGMVVVDVWERAETWQAVFADPAARAAFERAGVPEPSSVEILETHNTERGPAIDTL